MKDEIKEILDDIKKLVEEDKTPENMKKYVGGTFNVIELRVLLDYITNLQEKNERLQNIINELEQYIEMIDDRNSLKLQKVKDDMAKILKKD